MDKSPDAFRTISEVADWLGVQAHVLRFWESKFSHVKPVKRAGGRRYYRPADMQLLGGIKKLLHDDGLTIKGVQKTLREQGVGHVSSLSQQIGDGAMDNGPAAADAPVMSFRSAAKARSTATDDPQPIQIDHVGSVEPVQPEPPVMATDPAPIHAQPAPVSAPISAPEPVATAPGSEPEPEPEKSEPAAVEPTTEEKPILPSFLHRPAAPTKLTPAPLPEPEPEPEVAPLRARVVEAPDPPDETALPYARGPLAQLAKTDRLSARQAALIAPLAKQLHAWLGQSDSAGPT